MCEPTSNKFNSCQMIKDKKPFKFVCKHKNKTV